jgi:hypothetical protein
MKHVLLNIKLPKSESAQNVLTMMAGTTIAQAMKGLTKYRTLFPFFPAT